MDPQCCLPIGSAYRHLARWYIYAFGTWIISSVTWILIQIYFERTADCCWSASVPTLERVYPRGIQISLHIPSPGLQAFLGGGYFGVNFGHLKSEVFHLWGVFRSKLWSSQIWSFPLGGYFGVNFGHCKSEVFHLGGVFRSKLWSSQIWSFPIGGGFFGVNFWSSQIWSFPIGGVISE